MQVQCKSIVKQWKKEHKCSAQTMMWNRLHTCFYFHMLHGLCERRHCLDFPPVQRLAGLVSALSRPLAGWLASGKMGVFVMSWCAERRYREGGRKRKRWKRWIWHKKRGKGGKYPMRGRILLDTTNLFFFCVKHFGFGNFCFIYNVLSR